MEGGKRQISEAACTLLSGSTIAVRPRTLVRRLNRPEEFAKGLPLIMEIRTPRSERLIEVLGDPPFRHDNRIDKFLGFGPP